MPCRSRLAGDQGQRGIAGFAGRGQARSYRQRNTGTIALTENRADPM
ncbi:hypothetical protein [Desulfoglaeba alkanexedens]|nr:hypothetical protein [Desulfoglaeba alkanexedens]